MTFIIIDHCGDPSGDNKWVMAKGLKIDGRCLPGYGNGRIYGLNWSCCGSPGFPTDQIHPSVSQQTHTGCIRAGVFGEIWLNHAFEMLKISVTVRFKKAPACEPSKWNKSLEKRASATYNMSLIQFPLTCSVFCSRKSLWGGKHNAALWC